MSVRDHSGLADISWGWGVKLQRRAGLVLIRGVVCAVCEDLDPGASGLCSSPPQPVPGIRFPSPWSKTGAVITQGLNDIVLDNLFE